MKDENERIEALNAIFEDDPAKKAREKEIKKLEQKRQKQLEKMKKKEARKELEKENRTEDAEDVKEEPVKNYFADSDAASNSSAEDSKPLSDKPENSDKNDFDGKGSDESNSNINGSDGKKARKKRKEKKKQEKEEINIVKDLISLCLYILIIVAACWLILTYVGQRTEVSGDSMNDTLHDGDSLWIDKLSYRLKEPERFDIVVFPYQEEEDTYYIKRIIGLPGETVRIDEEGVIYINDEPLDENYGKETIEENHRGVAAESVTLGEDEYFVMGDNRNNSRDSRMEDVGNIHKDDFVGKAVFRFTGGFGFLNKEDK